MTDEFVSLRLPPAANPPTVRQNRPSEPS